jgi:hypothetical protein
MGIRDYSKPNQLHVTMRIVRTLASLALTTPALVAQTAGLPARWTVSATPTIEIGRDDVDERALLHRVAGATRLPSGDILVGDHGGTHALLFFSPRGALQRAVARKGGGPGEIRYLASMWRCGNAVFTEDIEEGSRISEFALDGSYRRAFRFASPDPGQPPYQSRCNGTRDFVHIGWESPRGARPGPFRPFVSLWRSGAPAPTASRVV